MGSVRIIAGELKGRRIAVPAGRLVRPTAERVREALFDILGGTVRGARVLDAYAGSGALGFEAASRGARTVVFLEADARQARLLRATAERFGIAPRCTVLEGRVLELLRRRRVVGPFDLVLVDAPYRSDEPATLLTGIARLLAAEGLVVIERDARSPAPEAAGLERERTARYGDTCLDFHRRAGPPAAGPVGAEGAGPPG